MISFSESELEYTMESCKKKRKTNTAKLPLLNHPNKELAKGSSGNGVVQKK